MLNIKTLIQSVYSYLVSGVKRSYRTFILMTAMIIASILLVAATTTGSVLTSEDEEELSSEDEDTELIVENSETLESEADLESESDTDETETETEYCLPLTNQIYTIVTFDVLNEEFELIDESASSESTNSTETDETDLTASLEAADSISSEMSNDEIASILVAGDLYAAEDGTILVANSLGMEITEEEYNVLLKIVEAEAGNEGIKGMVLVANVIMNRVNSSKYASTISGVVFQTGQFSPAKKGGSYYYVTPNANTIKAVNQALSGVDYSKGALYFCGSSAAEKFSKAFKFLFKHNGHYFYK